MEHVEHDALHVEKIVARERSIRYVHKIANLWCVNLLVLGSKKHGSAADKLQFLPRNNFSLQESVKKIHCQVKRLRHKL